MCRLQSILANAALEIIQLDGEIMDHEEPLHFEPLQPSRGQQNRPGLRYLPMKHKSALHPPSPLEAYSRVCLVSYNQNLSIVRDSNNMGDTSAARYTCKYRCPC